MGKSLLQQLFGMGVSKAERARARHDEGMRAAREIDVELVHGGLRYSTRTATPVWAWWEYRGPYSDDFYALYRTPNGRWFVYGDLSGFDLLAEPQARRWLEKRDPEAAAREFGPVREA